MIIGVTTYVKKKIENQYIHDYNSMLGIIAIVAYRPRKHH